MIPFAIICSFNPAFLDNIPNVWGIATFHTLYNIATVSILLPFSDMITKLSYVFVKEKEEDKQIAYIDPILINQSPAVAISECANLTNEMCTLSRDTIFLAIDNLYNYNSKTSEVITDNEELIDKYEDNLGTYLVKLSASEISPEESHNVTKLLHIIGDFERISDHAVNILESAEEMRDKKISFSEEAQKEITVMSGALDEIIELADRAYVEGDLSVAALVEPLEQVIDILKARIKLNHILRLQKNECSIEHGFVLSDLLTNFERVSDHCSNIAGCLIEISSHNALDMHKYLSSVKRGSAEFDERFNQYKQKYSL